MNVEWRCGEAMNCMYTQCYMNGKSDAKSGRVIVCNRKRNTMHTSERIRKKVPLHNNTPYFVEFPKSILSPTMVITNLNSVQHGDISWQDILAALNGWKSYTDKAVESC